MSLQLKPIYLLADSQLLFRSDRAGRSLLNSVRDTVESEFPKAAYIGASNGDDPIFYGVFESAVESIGLHQRRMIPSVLSEDDKKFLNHADVILLAGGDVKRGLRVFSENGVRDIVIRRYFEGALLIGVSAGSVQMGLPGSTRGVFSSNRTSDYFELVNCIVGVHEEADGWERLRQAVHLGTGGLRGIGIPSGGGAIYHADNSFEPLRTSLSEFLIQGDEMIHNILSPNDDGKFTGQPESADGSKRSYL